MIVILKEKFVIAFMTFFGSNSRNVFWSSGIIFIFMLVLHVYKSLVTGDYNWLGAYGALLTIYSLIFSFCHAGYQSFEKDIVPPAKFQSGFWGYCGEETNYIGEIVTEEHAKTINASHRKKIINKYVVSTVIYCLSIIGTLMWAYSSLLLNET